MDLGISSLQLDTRSAASPTPTTPRSTCGWTPSSRCRRPSSSTSGRRAPGERARASSARSATRARSPREIVRRRPLETTAELVEAIRAAVPPAYRFGRGHPAKRTFQAIRIAVNGELDRSTAALPLAWELLAEGGRLGGDLLSLARGPARQALPRRVARGCICPPELPVCVCGREPEAELLDPARGRPPSPRASANPRSRSARLRAARKLHDAGESAADGDRPPAAATDGCDRDSAQVLRRAAAARGRRAAAPASPARRRPSARRARPRRSAALVPSRSAAPRRRRRPRRLGLVVRLTRGRLWIGLLGALLVGHRRPQRDRAQLQRLLEQRRHALRRAAARELGAARSDRRRSRASRSRRPPGSGCRPAPGDPLPQASPGDAAAAAERLRDGADRGTGDAAARDGRDPVDRLGRRSGAAPTTAEPTVTDPAASASATPETASAAPTAAPTEAPAGDPAATGGGLAAP